MCISVENLITSSASQIWTVAKEKYIEARDLRETGHRRNSLFKLCSTTTSTANAHPHAGDCALALLNDHSEYLTR
jgi:hypothetical protein